MASATGVERLGVTGAEGTAHGATGSTYAHVLRLRRVQLHWWVRAIYVEGAIFAGIVLYLADWASAWSIVALPAVIAVSVKQYDLVLVGLAHGRRVGTTSAAPPSPSRAPGPVAEGRPGGAPRRPSPARAGRLSRLVAQDESAHAGLERPSPGRRRPAGAEVERPSPTRSRAGADVETPSPVRSRAGAEAERPTPGRRPVETPAPARLPRPTPGAAALRASSDPGRTDHVGNPIHGLAALAAYGTAPRDAATSSEPTQPEPDLAAERRSPPRPHGTPTPGRTVSSPRSAVPVTSSGRPSPGRRRPHRRLGP